MTRVPITRSGHHRLLKELAHLRQVVRPKLLDDLGEARSFGVTIANQHYLFARERLVMLERKIQELEEKLSLAEVFAGRKFIFKRVAFGAIVLIHNVDTGQKHCFQLVGPYESDAGNGKIAIDSPLGCCLMGCREGEEVRLHSPGGLRVYRILAIEFPPPT
jgi:transcription elongation factor GreA